MADRDITTVYRCSVEEALKSFHGSVWVALILEDRVYGGPEEGGWYYNSGDVKVQVQARLLEEISLAITFYKKFWSNNNRPAISSVNSVGRYTIVVGDKLVESWPEVKPHYE